MSKERFTRDAYVPPAHLPRMERTGELPDTFSEVPTEDYVKVLITVQYEAPEQKIEITREQPRSAWEKAIAPDMPRCLADLATAIGFKGESDE